jgi:exosome complex RNA-binding protein Csl4
MRTINIKTLCDTCQLPMVKVIGKKHQYKCSVCGKVKLKKDYNHYGYA